MIVSLGDSEHIEGSVLDQLGEAAFVLFPTPVVHLGGPNVNFAELVVLEGELLDILISSDELDDSLNSSHLVDSINQVKFDIYGPFSKAVSWNFISFLIESIRESSPKTSDGFVEKDNIFKVITEMECISASENSNGTD